MLLLFILFMISGASAQYRKFFSNSLHANSDDGFTHSANLDTNGDFTAFWRPGAKEKDNFVLEITGRTKGWLGFGFSPNGAMKDADIVLMWFDKNNKPQISVSNFL